MMRIRISEQARDLLLELTEKEKAIELAQTKQAKEECTQRFIEAAHRLSKEVRGTQRW